MERGALFFQIRQAFPPGEVTPEEANKIGYETAMRWTKARISSSSAPTLTRATFTITFITTPPPRTVPGNSITSSAPALRCGGSLTGCALSTSCLSFKIRSSIARAVFFTIDNGSGKSHPRPSSGCGWGSWRLWSKSPPTYFPAFLRLMEESGFQVKHGRGGAISFLAPGQDKYTRLRASTLGPGFDPDDIRAAIAGERPIPELPQDSPPRPGASI